MIVQAFLGYGMFVVERFSQRALYMAADPANILCPSDASMITMLYEEFFGKNKIGYFYDH